MTGDTVNVAARLEQAAAPGEILIGEPHATGSSATPSTSRRSSRSSSRARPSAVPAFRLLDVMPGAPAVAPAVSTPRWSGGRTSSLGCSEAFERRGAERACQLVTVLGDAGVGKSRLATEFVAARPDRARSLWGRCLPYGEGITFWPVAEMVKAAAGIDEDDPPEDARAKVARLLGGADDGADVADRVAAAIGLGRRRRGHPGDFWAIRRLLEILAADGPLVVIVRGRPLGGADVPGPPAVLAGSAREHPILVLVHVAAGAPRDASGLGRRRPTMIALAPLTEDESSA